MFKKNLFVSFSFNTEKENVRSNIVITNYKAPKNYDELEKITDTIYKFKSDNFKGIVKDSIVINNWIVM